MESARPLQSISDDELLRRLGELLRQSRRVEADLVAHIGEVDQRGLFAREAAPSMFAYCTEVLHLSEAEAYLRIAAARAARKHPVLLAMLGDGRLHLTAIVKLAPHLTGENCDQLLQQAVHRSKRRIEELVAALAPRPDVAASVRKVPESRSHAGAPLVLELSPGWPPTSPLAPLHGPNGLPGRDPALGASGSASSADRAATPVFLLRPDGVASKPPRVSAAVVEPLSPARYKVQFTAGAELRDKLTRLQALMRYAVPDGDLAAIIEQAVTEKLERLEARRFAKTAAPRKRLEETSTTPASRRVPAAVRRAVRERDGNRCAFVDELGRRCPARDRLEYHHRRPFGFGGDHDPRNIGLLCRVHNAYLARHDYGRRAMSRYQRANPDAPAMGAGDSAVPGGGQGPRGQP